MKARIVVLLIAAAYLHASDAQGYAVNGRELAEELQPMYLKRGSNEFLSFDSFGNLNIQIGDQIDLYCETGFMIPNARGPILTATYEGRSARPNEPRFRIRIVGNLETTQSLKNVKCSRDPTVVLRQRGACGQYRLVEVGYNVYNRGFNKIYEICYDHDRNIAKYVKHTIQPGARHGFNIRFPFYGLDGYRDIEPYYHRRDRSLDRGHLAPNGDFFYGAQKLSSFFYGNIAPQRKAFNGGNWNNLEFSNRIFFKTNILECYTGVISEDNGPYLDRVHNRIPIPILFFRVLYEPSFRRAVVFVGVNDVSLRRGMPLPARYVKCRNVIRDRRFNSDFDENQEWVTDYAKGYLYACDYNDFRRTNNYNYLPELRVDGPLRFSIFEREERQ